MSDFQAEDYFSRLPDDRRDVMRKLWETICDAIPPGFEAYVSYGMPGFAVPFSRYPSGYHCDPKQPLPFMGIASQKNHISFYHMGLYAMPELLAWFEAEYPKHAKSKLDMGKSCVRFKKPDQIPFALLSELLQKVSVEDWISVYESNLLPKDKKKSV